MQIQAAQQLAQNAMTTKDYWTLGITACFTILAGVLGSVLTLWWQNRRAKRDEKMRVFTALMMHRQSNPPHFEWVNALNLIDIVFAENDEVLGKWHALYKIFVAQQVGTEDHRHTYLEMLSAMAKDLGYKKLQQTDIEKFYTPMAFANQANANAQLQAVVANFFGNINNLIEGQKLALPVVQPPIAPIPPPASPPTQP